MCPSRVIQFLAAGCLYIAVSAQSTTDPCLKLAAHNSSRFPESFLRPSEINACMATLPVNKTAGLDLIKGVGEMLDIYSYEPYAKHTNNSQLSVSVDLKASLKKIREDIDQVTSFPEFSRQVNNLMNSLYDGHTVLALDCSGRISYDAFLPLAYFKTEGNDDARIYVHPEYDQFLVDRKINETTQFQLQRSLAGAEVLKIDGIDTVTYMTRLLTDQDILFGNIDPQTRWNQLFVNLRGHPTPRLGYGVALTSLARAYQNSDDLKLTVSFNNGTVKNVTIPWFGLVETDYYKVKSQISFQKYYTEYVCLAGNSTQLLRAANETILAKKGAVRGSRSTRLQHSAHEQQYLFDQEYRLVRDAPPPLYATAMTSRNRDEPDRRSPPSSTTTIPGADSQLQKIGSIDSGFWIYHFQNTSVGVLYLANFSDDDKENKTTTHMDLFHHRYTRAMTKGLKDLKAKGVDTLLIDVSGNNGGLTELGSFVMLSLFPAQYPGFGTTLRSNNEMLSYLDGSDGQQGFCRADGTKFKSVSDWLAKDNTTMTINSERASYSQLTVDNLVDNEAWEIVGNATFPQHGLFSPAKMMIVSNGKCASTCAQVAMYLQDIHGVKSVGFGGRPGSAHALQTVGGVRGAQVVEMLDEDDASNNMYNFSMKVTQMTINFRTAIHYHKRIPTEYVTRNVDFSYQHTRDTFNSFENTWRMVGEKHFSKAMKQAPIPKPIDSWAPLREYPAGWFDHLLSLDSAMDKARETEFPKTIL